MTNPSDPETELGPPKTRAGRLLFRQLPEAYRFLDGPSGDEPGDLAAFLHGFGHLLDLIRGTTEQAYADAFAEPVDVGFGGPEAHRQIQTWLLPYLAELVGSELLSPDPEQRRKELAETVGWYKTKGTLRNADSIADIVSGTETVTVEGWRRVATTPRLGLPPFAGSAPATGDGDPLGTPDLRWANRAVVDPDGANPFFRLTLPGRDGDGRIAASSVTYWKPRAQRGFPCFPGAYDDVSVRTPDLRDPRANPAVGPHPRRTLLHVRPPYGFFEPGLHKALLADGTNPLKLDLSDGSVQTRTPKEMFNGPGPTPDKLTIEGDLTIPAGVRVAFEDLLFTGKITVQSSPSHDVRLKLTRCAVKTLELPSGSATPDVEALDCLIGEIAGGGGFAQLVYCTVLGGTQLERLWASDCIFNGDLVGVKCDHQESGIRYSRVPDLSKIAGCVPQRSPHVVTDDPNFVSLYFEDSDDCKLRPAAFGEPGAGVLDLTSSSRLLTGSEDGGEMGAMHHLFHVARIEAVRRKLADFLPLSQEVAIRYDPHLARPAAALE
jgi:hypothetical protein